MAFLFGPGCRLRTAAGWESGFLFIPVPSTTEGDRRIAFLYKFLYKRQNYLSLQCKKELINLYCMKKSIITFILGCLMLSSCTTVEQSTYVNVFDYTPFHQQGIYVSESDQVDFDYKPLGSVLFTTRGATGLFWRELDMGKASQDIIGELRKRRADGLINFKTSIDYTKEAIYLSVSGMAIRRLERISTPETQQTAWNDPNAPSCTIDGVRCIVEKDLPSGVKIITDKKLTPKQILRMVETLGMQGRYTMVAELGNPNAYAGTTEKDYFVNYETNDFIKFSDVK